MSCRFARLVCDIMPFCAGADDLTQLLTYCRALDARDLRRDAKVEGSKTIKILLLGTGASGKTTFLKQLQLMYSLSFKHVVHGLY